jgi:thioredoxin reductase
MSTHSDFPVAVIGGGPVGLAAAAHLVTRGVPVKLYESGSAVAAHVRDWGHVRLFSPWRFNTDPTAAALLREHGWRAPADEGLPSGRELVDRYLEPLAQLPRMRSVIETDAYVSSVSRQGIDKVVSERRAEYPFALTVRRTNGDTRLDFARAVIDASGTWQHPNPLGAAGTSAVGEVTNNSRFSYGIPDVLGAVREDYTGLRLLVVGGGHSAANVLLDLVRLADSDAALRLTWAVRSTNLTRVFGGGASDQLPARGKLGSDLKNLVARGRLDLVTGFRAERVDNTPEGVWVGGRGVDGDLKLGPFDHIIVATGQRPDLALTRELRLDLDPWLECPRALGPMIDPNLHSCGTVPPHGYKELAHHEPGYFAAGVKSYGRAPTFLMATGYEQVRSVVAHLAGDHVAANDVRLVLPETGVCSADLVPDDAVAEGCCGGPAPALVDACCAEDAAAKAAGKTGCGDGKPELTAAEVQKAKCCTTSAAA